MNKYTVKANKGMEYKNEDSGKRYEIYASSFGDAAIQLLKWEKECSSNVVVLLGVTAEECTFIHQDIDGKCVSAYVYKVISVDSDICTVTPIRE